jgi:hypothetical protein
MHTDFGPEKGRDIYVASTFAWQIATKAPSRGSYHGEAA